MIRIPLRARNGSLRDWAIVDDEDAYLAEKRWARHSAGYAYRLEDRYAVYMHRLILGLEKGNPLEGDHIDGNRLNNRRANLRAVTQIGQSQNMPSRGGRSRFRGVYMDRRRKHQRWYGQVQFQGKKYTTSRFTTEEAAAEAVGHLRESLMPYAVQR